MMLKELSRYNPWWTGQKRNHGLFARERFLSQIYKHMKTRDIIIITGLRRVGKTSLMLLTIDSLISSGVDPKHILYVSLDDYNLQKNSIIDIVEEYRSIHKLTFDQKVYLFFDEITYRTNFELQLKNIYDSHSAKVIASSSAASVLRDRQHLLTGRSSTIEILPLNFKEYLQFKKVEITPSNTHLNKTYFQEFMKAGGIPEFVLHGNISYLKDLVDDIIYKDIAVVYKVQDVQLLKDFFLLLMERSGKQVSLNKMKNILGISVDSVRRYFDMFVRTYLIHPVLRYGKTNERILNPKKVYAPDLGVLNMFTGFRDLGAIFENYVFLEMKHHNLTYYMKDGCEIDFVVDKKELVEVKYHNKLEGKQLDVYMEAPFDKKRVITDWDQV